MAYTRGEHCNYGGAIDINSDEPYKWTSYMTEHSPGGIRYFEKNLLDIKTAVILCPRTWNLERAARQLACAYKLGDPFPSHFQYAGKSYNLNEPEWLQNASKRNKKSAAWIHQEFQNMTRQSDDGQSDEINWLRFTTLLIGITFAGKITTHWEE